MASVRSDATSGAARGGAPRDAEWAGSPQGAHAPLPPVSMKILVAGGFGVGKTTFVGAVSEIRPLRTEELLSDAGADVDDTTGVDAKVSTTVAMDFGRISISEQVVIYLFGTPGQERFWFLWDDLAEGALGAVVLADTRRLSDCFAAIDYFERAGLPFLIAVNCFDGSRHYPISTVRTALDLDEDVPVVLCDARGRESARDALVALAEHAMNVGAVNRAEYEHG